MPTYSRILPYYYGAHKWDNYLLDIQETLEEAHAQGQELGEAQLNELRDQTDELRETRRTLESGFEAMRAAFHWGFTLFLDRMDRQLNVVAEIAAKLDEIHKTLQSPLLTQARELFRLGQQRLHKGLLAEALDAFRRSEEKDEVDFLLQLQMGKLLLYGKDSDDDVIDVPEAERHLLLSARFAEGENESVPGWKRYCGEAYFHAAIAAYLLGEEEARASRSDGVTTCLERALRHLTKSRSLWPEFLESAYTQAKCHALLRQRAQALQALELLADRDRRYFAKAAEDRDFDLLRAEVDGLCRNAALSPGSFATATRAKIASAAEALEWAKRASWGPESTAVTAKRELLEHADSALRSFDVDIVALAGELDRARHALMDAAASAYTERANLIAADLKTQEWRRAALESAIRETAMRRKETSGSTSTGCLVGFIVYFGSFVTSVAVASAVFPDAMFPLLAAGAMILGSVAFYVTGAITRMQKRRPLEQEIDRCEKAIPECDRAIEALRRHASNLEQEAEEFADWRTRAS